MSSSSIPFHIPFSTEHQYNDQSTPHRIVRPTGTDCWILELTTSGAGIAYTPERSIPLVPGDVVLYAPSTPQDYGMCGQTGHWTHYWICFFPRPHWQDWLKWTNPASGLGHIRLPDEVRLRAARRRLDRVRSRLYGSDPRGSELAMAALEETLLWLDSMNPVSSRVRFDPRIQQVLEWMRRNYAQSATIAQLAGMVHLSPSRFSHLFSRQTAAAPLQYLADLRIARARELLTMSSLPIAAIAEECGFANPFYFSRVFSQRIGASPREFRTCARSTPQPGRTTSTRACAAAKRG